MKRFSVTFERWTHEDIELGDTDDRGYVIKDVSLRDAIQIGLEYREPSWAGACESDCSNHALTRGITFYNWNEGTREYYETGITEQRSLHLPDDLTPSSRRRITSLFLTL